MKPTEFLEEYYEKKKKEAQLPQQETFVSKGSDDKNYTENYTDNYPELDGINNLVPQQEISDEEIEKASNTLGDYYASELIMWENGAKWYREQLKKK